MARPRPQSYPQPRTIRVTTAVLFIALAFAAGLLLGSLSISLQSGQSAGPVGGQAQNANTNDPKAHLAQIEKMTREQPENGKMWIHLGDAYYDAKDPVRAIPAYERGLTLLPDNLDARTDLGTMYRLSGQHEKALAQYNEVITRNPRHRNARFNKGIVLYYDLGRKQEGIAAWNALLSVMPDAVGPEGQPLADFIAKHSAQ